MCLFEVNTLILDTIDYAFKEKSERIYNYHCTVVLF